MPRATSPPLAMAKGLITFSSTMITINVLIRIDYPAFDSAAPIITSPLLPTPPPITVLNILPSHSTQLYFLGDDIQMQDLSHERHLTNHPFNQPSPLLMFTNDSDYMSPHFSLPTTTDLFFSPSILVVQDETTTPILTILGAPDLVSFKLSVSSQTVFISTHI